MYVLTIATSCMMYATFIEPGSILRSLGNLSFSNAQCYRKDLTYGYLSFFIFIFLNYLSSEHINIEVITGGCQVCHGLGECLSEYQP